MYLATTIGSSSGTCDKQRSRFICTYFCGWFCSAVQTKRDGNEQHREFGGNPGKVLHEQTRIEYD
jgi:hypothetical protein